MVLGPGRAAAQGAPAANAATAEQKREAKQHLDAAAAAEKTKAFGLAATEYRAAYAAEPSAAAVQGIAGAEDSQKRPLEAMAAYEQLLAEFGPTLSAKSRTTATARLSALAPKVGTIAVRVTPEGATLAVDGVTAGVTPLAKPIRVLPGSHRITATKASFKAAALAVDVSAGAEVTAEFGLTPEATVAPISITEAKGAALTLTIDGKVVGPLPWTGELEAGTHEVSAMNDTLSAPKQTITVESGRKLDLALVAAPRVGKLDLHTADGIGVIFIDGKAAAEGHYVDAVAIGPHRFSFVREGYERVELAHDVSEGETWREVVTLQPTTRGPERTTPERAKSDDRRGVVGEVRVAISTQLGSTGSESETNCSTLGGGCTANTPFGAGLLFAVGYMVDHFGGDLFFGASLDSASRTYSDINGAGKSYSVARAGGIQALRARGSIQTERFRGNLALGPGIAERVVGIGKSFPAVPTDIQTYISLAFTIDVNGQLRLGSSTALTLGMMLWVENAGDGVTTQSAPTRGSFHLVAGAQSLFMPYLGFQFGP